jgi:dipeptidyl aminopeptidase/acylaminoacyl peptidase
VFAGFAAFGGFSAFAGFAAFAAFALSAASPVSAAGRPLAVDDLMAMQRVSDPRISPDASRVLYTVATPDLTANRLARNVWMVSAAGGDPKALTTTGHDWGARWSPDGRRIAYVSTSSGATQLWLMNADGGDKRQVTSLSGDVDNIVWSPDGRMIAFTSEVYPDCRNEACNAERDKAREQTQVKARVYDRLLYRHWTSWSDGKRAHLFVMPAAGGMPRDLLPGADYDVPPIQREGSHPIAFSPDSRTLCFTAVTDAVEATSTNGDLFEIDAAGGTPRRLTTNPGFDGAPAYSPDGTAIAYHSQARPGVESDRWRLMVYNRATAKSTSLVDAFDRSVESPEWSPDGTAIYFNAEDRGEMPVFAVSVGTTPSGPGAPRPVAPDSFNGEFQVGAGGLIIVARSSLAAPVELFAIESKGGTGAGRQLTYHNSALLAGLDLAKPESFTFKGAAAAAVQGFLIRPPAFDAAKKYPVVMILHGGPETQHSDTWSYRWNAQLFASPGYVVLLINRRGSTGFGQKFTDEIVGDWGGKPLEDLMNGLDYALGKYPFTDRQRVAAAGGSYGGYMIDWLESQSKGRFRALISHAGVYDLTSSYGATEELWFPEHEFGGPPWTGAANYQKQSPDTFAADFGRYKTPTLVIAGEQDFRVPYTQSLEFYTALQRQGVPSRLIVFPDEGHWVLKPQNSVFWYREVMSWLHRYLDVEASGSRKSASANP